MRLEDGTGRGYEQKVDANNDAHVRAITRNDDHASTEDGDSYNINSGLITLTGVVESGILYVKNNETRDFEIDSIEAILGPSTGGATTDTTRVRIYKNPTTGTLISTATAADTNSNRNFGSSKTLASDAYKGAEAETITDGSVHIEVLISPGTREIFEIDEILTKGDSIAISFEPNDSNTSMKAMAAIIGHLKDADSS